MTDEEMAEEYVKKEGFRSGTFGELDNITSSEANKEIKQAFLVGLKAGRPQWHDLKKDPTDLPKKNKSYWVYVDCQGNKIYRSIVWQGCWCGWNGIPLAWCEEPQFDKE